MCSTVESINIVESGDKYLNLFIYIALIILSILNRSPVHCASGFIQGWARVVTKINSIEKHLFLNLFNASILVYRTRHSYL